MTVKTHSTAKNWMGEESFEVKIFPKSEHAVATVALSMSGGRIHFCEHFTPAQAIDLAAALVDFATEIQDAETTEGATPCGTVSNGYACTTLRVGNEKLCPDCNAGRTTEGAAQ